MEFQFLKSDSSEWSDVLKKFPHDFYHLQEYTELEAQRSSGTAEAFLVQQGEKCFFVPYCVRPAGKLPQDVTSVYGYPSPLTNVKDDEPFLKSAILLWLEQLKQRDVCAVFVRFNPLLNGAESAWGQSGTLVSHGSTIHIDLTQTHEELWQQTKKRHKSEINKLKKDDEFKIEVSFDHYQEFIRIYYQTMDKLNASKGYYFDQKYFDSLKSALKDSLSLISVIHQGHVAASAMFIRTGDLVQYHLSATALEYLPKAPTKWLLHEAAAYYKNQGAKVLHLGGGLGGVEDNLFQFKSGFSELKSEFFTWRKILQEEKYLKATAEVFKEKNIVGTADLDVSAFFPKYRM